MTQTPKVENFRSATAVHAGPLNELGTYTVEHPKVGPISGKLWLKEHLNLSGMEISFGILPAETSVPFSHAHKQNEELYVFISGQGQMLVDGEIIDVREGSAVRIAPPAQRCWRSTGSQDLIYLVIQAKEDSLEQWTRTDGIPSPEAPQWP